MRPLTLLSVLIIAAILISVYSAGANEPEITGRFAFTTYINNEKGIDLPGDQKFNIAAFYHDVLLASSGPGVLVSCSEADDFNSCVEDNSNKEMTQKYEQEVKNIERAVDFGKQHGIDYGTPFVNDFLG